jgi:hypothetical protein
VLTIFFSKLEELDEIFNSRNPVKKSIEKKRLEVDSQANVVHVELLEKPGSTGTDANA